jgi:hypothetical protein
MSAEDYNVQEVCASSQKNNTIEPSLTSKKWNFIPFGPLEMWESQWAQHNMMIHDHLVLLHTNHDCLKASWVSVRTPNSQPWEQTANNSESGNKLHMEQANLHILLIMVFLCCSNVHHTQRDFPTERLNPSSKLKLPYSFTATTWMASCRSLQLPQAKKGARKLPALETTWVGATQNIINKK